MIFNIDIIESKFAKCTNDIMSAIYSLGVSNSHVQIANIFIICILILKILILVSGPSTCCGPKSIAYLA